MSFLYRTSASYRVAHRDRVAWASTGIFPALVGVTQGRNRGGFELAEDMRTKFGSRSGSALSAILLCMFLGILFVDPPRSFAEDLETPNDELTPDDLVEKIGAAYRDFRKDWKPAKIDLQFSERTKPTGPWKKSRVQYRSTKDGRYQSLLSEVEANGQIEGKVYCITPEYAFRLGRGTKDAAWAIVVYGEKNANELNLSANYENVKRILDITDLDLQFQLVCMNLIPIDKLLAHPVTTITGVEYENDVPGQRLVNIHFETSDDRTIMGEVAPMNIADLSGSIKLNEKHGWRPVKHRLRTRTGGEIHVQYDGYQQINGFDIPTKLRRHIVKADGTKWTRIKDSSRKYDYDAKFGPETFTLTEYGLPKALERD